MNKIELLPKDIYYKNDLYQIRMWVTFMGRLCIGYQDPLNKNPNSLFSVCVEPENEPRTIESTIGYLNQYVGNMKSVDDACDELLNWIEKNKENFKFD